MDKPTIYQPLSTVLTLLGITLILVGYFAPWIPHRAAGLSLTGFEIAEWIKFAPGVSRRGHFYWPPIAAVLGLTMLAAGRKHRGQPLWWAPTIMAAILSLLPFPLLEEVSDLNGIQVNLERLGLTGFGLAATGLVVLQRKLSGRIWGLVLAITATASLALVSAAFSAAEPIVERLLDQLIDPGLGYHLVRGGLTFLLIAGITQSLNRKKGQCSR